MKKQYYCEKCGKTMAEDQFYKSNNKQKYTNGGVVPTCKKCLTMHVDNWNPDTYLWLLQELDVPYIPDEWNKLMMKYAKDPDKVTGTTIIGRYLSKMKLNQWKEYRWKDNDFIKELQAKRIREAMKDGGYDIQEIEMAIERANYELPTEELKEPEYTAPAPVPEYDDYSATSASVYQFEPVEEIDLGLTDEDITYLRLKWGKNYKQEEWVQLEQLYNEMMESYDIQTAGHIDTLKLICKTSLKANQLIDIGDIEGYQKIAKVYDSLMKSGKFTAAQNKAEQGEYVDSISEFVALCEKDGFIPRYYVDGPQDKVDRIIEDMKFYTRTLVTEEMGLGNLIENAVKRLEKKQEQAEEAAETEGSEEDKLFDYNSNLAISDSDFQDFFDWEEQEEMENEDYLKQFFEEE